MDGAVLHDLFKCRAMFLTDARRKVDPHRQLGDSARRLGGHVLFDFYFKSRQIEVFVAIGINAHDRRNTTRQRRCNQIRRRERFAFAVIVNRRVSS